jgi:hypothetical protein
MHTLTAALSIAAAACASACTIHPAEPLSPRSVVVSPSAPPSESDPAVAADDSTPDPAAQPELEPGAILRVGGEPPHEVVREWDDFRAGPCAITTPLPDGYPDPTPPGAIDIKRYPAVRRAEVSGSGWSDVGMNVAFFPLFQHIKNRDIAMTSPVEMDYPPSAGAPAPELPGEQPPPRRWTMSFLYRSPDLGPIGIAERNVRVVDIPPMTVISIGLRGPYSETRIREALEPLYDWLAANPEWKVAGAPRALYYNGPERRNADKWAEAQIPIRRAE